MNIIYVGIGEIVEINGRKITCAPVSAAENAWRSEASLELIIRSPEIIVSAKKPIATIMTTVIMATIRTKPFSSSAFRLIKLWTEHMIFHQNIRCISHSFGLTGKSIRTSRIGNNRNSHTPDLGYVRCYITGTIEILKKRNSQVPF